MKVLVFHKSSKYNILFSFLITLLIIYILYNSSAIAATIKTNITLFLYNLIPAIFVPIFITNILIQSNAIYSISFGLSKLACKIFKIPAIACPVIFIAMFLGYPNSAKFLSTLYSKNLVTKNECTKILSFTSNANPAYIVSTVGIAFYQNVQIGIILLISHILSSLILGILLNIRDKNIIQQSIQKEYSKVQKNLGFNVIFNSIFSTLRTLALVFSFMTLFAIISSTICSKLNLTGIAQAMFTGLFEITNGLSLLSTCGIDFTLKMVLSSFILSFGSFMILYQIYAVSYNCGISFKKFAFNKVKHGVLSSIITYILVKALNICDTYTPVFSNNYISSAKASSLLFIFNTILIFCICFVMSKHLKKQTVRK